MKRIFAMILILAARAAFAFGPWLEMTPIGGVELSDGWSREQLERRFDEIAAANTNKPFIVTRTKWMCEAFDHVRLAVNTNDLFVHWHADCAVIPLRFQKRMAVLRKNVRLPKGPAHGWSTIDTSHTCPDWKSVLALGPKGLADRARARLKTAKTDDERLFLSCVAEVYDGLVRECVRWADFAAAKGMPVGPWLTESIGDVPVRFGHDASVFFRGGVYLENMGEHRNLCGATLGTGLGFGSMKDGTILVKETGYPGITIWGREYRDSIAEDYVSRRAVIREYETASGKTGLDVYEISLLARSGDSAARHAFDELGRNLGVVVKDVLIENGFTAFLLGGAISKSADLLMPALLRELSNMPFTPEVRAVRDIDNAPLYGAAAMCLE